jgi:hypothetical protein
MHSFLVSIVINYSIAIPALLAIIRFKHIYRSFYPLVFLIWLVLANESLSIAMVFSTGSNTVNSNLFVLAEFLLLLLQFFSWNTGSRRSYFLAAGFGIAVWITDNLLLNTLSQNNSLFRAFYSFVVLLFSIKQISKILNRNRRNLLKDAVFIICITFLFYYGCKSYIEMMNAFHLGLSRLVLWNLWIIMYFVNAISNILYALAILCIPTRQEFILPY